MAHMNLDSRNRRRGRAPDAMSGLKSRTALVGLWSI